jgi:hypothetical protein
MRVVETLRPNRMIATAGLALLVATWPARADPLIEYPVPLPPPDPLSLLNALQPRLPPTWRMGQPYIYLDIPYVRVNIMDEWRGNPISAAIAMCPGSDDPIWELTPVIRLVMRHHQRNWPPYECRP